MNIYVGNLPFGVSEDDVRQAFAAYGTVSSVSIIKDHETGQSRGFGFVEMTESAEGTAAIAALNGKPLKGRALKVNEARPREASGVGGGPRRPSSGDYGGDRGGDAGQRRPGGGGFGDRGSDRGGDRDRRGGSGTGGGGRRSW
jgi:RNA recognition motif-containing protein